MSSPDPTPPTAIPWYQSKVIQGVAVSVLSQILARTKFASLFTSDNVTAIVGYVFDGISAAALWYSTHARVTQKSAPQVVSSQTKADVINQEAKK